MVIAMALMGMMQMTFHEIIGVASMRNRFMTATGAMGVPGVVFAARMIGGASRRIRTTFVEGVFVYMALVGTVEMSLVQVIDMTLVPHPGVSAPGAMRMRMLVMCFVVAHFTAPLIKNLGDATAFPNIPFLSLRSALSQNPVKFPNGIVLIQDHSRVIDDPPSDW